MARRIGEVATASQDVSKLSCQTGGLFPRDPLLAEGLQARHAPGRLTASNADGAKRWPSLHLLCADACQFLRIQTSWMCRPWRLRGALSGQNGTRHRRQVASAKNACAGTEQMCQCTRRCVIARRPAGAEQLLADPEGVWDEFAMGNFRRKSPRPALHGVGCADWVVQGVRRAAPVCRGSGLEGNSPSRPPGGSAHCNCSEAASGSQLMAVNCGQAR